MTSHQYVIGAREDIRPGSWWCMCCIDDLYEISDETEADAVREYFDEGIMRGVWPAERDARAYLSEHP